MLSPLAAQADVMFVVSADSVGPFDSHVGTLALLNLVVAEVAGSLRNSAARPPRRGRGGVDAGTAR